MSPCELIVLNYSSIMGLWAWIIYSYNYMWSTLIVPFSLMWWQNIYLVNTLFVIQEIADTFGLLLILMLLLLGQLIARNSLLSIFLSFTQKNVTNSEQNLYSRVRTTSLQTFLVSTISHRHLQFIPRMLVKKFTNMLKK